MQRSPQEHPPHTSHPIILYARPPPQLADRRSGQCIRHSAFAFRTPHHIAIVTRARRRPECESSCGASPLGLASTGPLCNHTPRMAPRHTSRSHARGSTSNTCRVTRRRRHPIFHNDGSSASASSTASSASSSCSASASASSSASSSSSPSSSCSSSFSSS